MKINFTNINCIKYLNKEIVFLDQLEIPEDWERKAFTIPGSVCLFSFKIFTVFLIHGFKRFQDVLFF